MTRDSSEAYPEQRIADEQRRTAYEKTLARLHADLLNPQDSDPPQLAVRDTGRRVNE